MTTIYAMRAFLGGDRESGLREMCAPTQPRGVSPYARYMQERSPEPTLPDGLFKHCGARGQVLGFGTRASLRVERSELAMLIRLDLEVYKNKNAFRHPTFHDFHEQNCAITLRVVDLRDVSIVGTFRIDPRVSCAHLREAKELDAIADLSGEYSFSPRAIGRAFEQAAVAARQGGADVRLPSEVIEKITMSIRDSVQKKIAAQQGVLLGNIPCGEFVVDALSRLHLPRDLEVLAASPQLPELVDAATRGQSYGDLSYRSADIATVAGGLRGAGR